MENGMLFAYVSAFYDAYLTLSKENEKCELGEKVFPLAPIIVNGAFATELALKSILTECKIPYEKEHGLYQLFTLLPVEYIKEIFARMKAISPEYDFDNFEVDFTLFSNVYYEWRYAYEKKPVLFCQGYYMFIKAIVETQLSRHKMTITHGPRKMQTDEEKEKQKKQKMEAYKIAVTKRKRLQAKKIKVK